MKTRRNYQVSCPACRARIGQPCIGQQGERLPGVHFQRTTALRNANLAAFKALYAPLAMRGLLLLAFGLCAANFVFGQTVNDNSVAVQTPAPEQQPSYANYSIMLVNPGTGSGVAIMHNPKNMLEFVDASKIGDALKAGYVPVRSVELAELIQSFKEEIARLTQENTNLLVNMPRRPPETAPVQGPSPAELEERHREQVAAEKAERRRTALAMWGIAMMGMSRQQPYQPQYLGTTAYTNCN